MPPGVNPISRLRRWREPARELGGLTNMIGALYAVALTNYIYIYIYIVWLRIQAVSILQSGCACHN